jgi:hypothetical protein
MCREYSAAIGLALQILAMTAESSRVTGQPTHGMREKRSWVLQIPTRTISLLPADLFSSGNAAPMHAVWIAADPYM